MNRNAIYALPDEKQLQEILHAASDRHRIPGIAVGLAVRDRTVVTRVGTLAADSGIPLPQEARFAIACVTKLLVALVSLEMVHAGRLALDAPIDEFLPDFRGTVRGRNQLLRHLLSLATGYQDMSEAAIAANNWIEFAEARQLFTPGATFSYEHAAFVILGEILQRITGSSVNAFLTEQIFEPLGIAVGDVTQPGPDDAPAIIGHEFDAKLGRFHRTQSPQLRSNGAQSNFTLSIGDMLKLARAVAAPCATQSRGALSFEAVRLLQTPCSRLPMPIAGTGVTGLPVAVNLGCFRYPHGLYGVDGGSSGQVCSVRFHPETRTCVTLGLNIGSSIARGAIIDSLLEALGWPLEEPAVTCRRTYDFDLAKLLGTYIGTNGSQLTVSHAPSQLVFSFLRESNASELRLVAAYDPRANTIALSGRAGLAGLAVFLDPADAVPCVGLGVIMFRKWEKA